MSSEPFSVTSPSPEPPLWRGTFSQYFDLVQKRPQLAESAHRRLWRMIVAQGDKGQDGSYPFFGRHLYGMDDTITRLVDDYFRPAAQGFDVKKRILLLVGPVSGGKSSLATLMKRGLEQFTRTESGAVYAISGCPMHEEPLHLIPDHLRGPVEDRLGIVIEGDLCPWCRFRLEHEFGRNISQVPVERITFSERRRVGIGTYAPSDPKSQDIADLIGSLDFQAIAQYGSESDPRAYRFDGELNIANRGFIEFQEMLKLDEKFLYHLLSLSQEGNFKTGRYELISADMVILGHTNEHEYRAFVQNPRNEALLSRLFVLPVPYNLDHRQEIRIYQKLLAPYASPAVHVAPHTLEVAAAVAVLSRVLEEAKPGGDRMSRFLIYSGQGDSEERQKLLQEGRSLGEGMQGLDPRYVLNRLAALLARPGVQCVGPLDVLAALKEGVLQTPFGDRGWKNQVAQWVQMTREWYNRQVEAEVLEAFAVDWDEQLENLYQNYLDNVVTAVKAPGNPADERLMRSIEERMGITEAQTSAFREEITLRMEMARDREEKFGYRDHPGLARALKDKLFEDMRDEVKITTKAPIPDRRTLARIEQAVERLVSSGPYCSRCASQAVHHVGGLLNR